MLRLSSQNLRGVFHNAPTTYPFVKPFRDTPFDQDRTRFDKANDATASGKLDASQRWPAWMEEGADGTGYGIGLHRTHPLSPLKGNLKRGAKDIPRVLNMMIQGVWHKSGNKLYFRGGKPPNPSVHPYLTGEPCPVYGWKVTDPNVIRGFHVPNVDKEKMRYKPYVALHERRLLGEEGLVPSSGNGDPRKGSSGTTKSLTSRTGEVEKKPLVKRLFFWQ